MTDPRATYGVLAYNHLSTGDDRAPRPFVRARVPMTEVPTGSGWVQLQAEVQTAEDGPPIAVQLDTDCPHSANFFRLNWPEPRAWHSQVDARLVAYRLSAECYGLPPACDTAILISPDARCAVLSRASFYTKLKTAMRVLCSAHAPPDQLYLHGCSVDLGGRGLLICGPSGAGKTTLALAIMSRVGRVARVVNDDWGALSLLTFRAAFTGEASLHMKYRTVVALAPGLTTDPEIYPSECYSALPADPVARLMIPREDVFGSDRIASATTVEQVLFVSRTEPNAPFCRQLTERDVGVFDAKDGATEEGLRTAFLDAASLLDDPAIRLRHLQLHQRLLASGRCFAINSYGDPDLVAARALASASPADRSQNHPASQSHRHGETDD